LLGHDWRPWLSVFATELETFRSAAKSQFPRILLTRSVMFIQPIDYFLAAWFILAGASALYVAIDQYRNNPKPMVMKWAFIMVLWRRCSRRL
jgi:hypothetical protein